MKKRQGTAGACNEFENIYKEYFTELYAYVYRRVGHRQMAEDVVQETFLIAFEKGRQFLEHPNPKWWLLRTARNKTLELHKKAKRRSVLSLEQDCPEAAWEEASFGERELEMTALEILDEKEWMMVKSYYLFGEPVSELAKSEKTTENNIRVRLTRLKKKLKKGICN